MLLSESFRRDRSERLGTYKLRAIRFKKLAETEDYEFILVSLCDSHC